MEVTNMRMKKDNKYIAVNKDCMRLDVIDKFHFFNGKYNKAEIKTATEFVKNNTHLTDKDNSDYFPIGESSDKLCESLGCEVELFERELNTNVVQKRTADIYYKLD